MSATVTLGQSTSPILPSPVVPQNVPGIFGPDYSFSDNIPLPSEIGVYDGDDVPSVMSAAKAAAFYADAIGYGESSNRWSQGFNKLKPIGVNTFIESGQTCSNGAKMWEYIEGVPTGNAVGTKIADRLYAAGLPSMRGLAPGILEDIESALDPTPMVSAVFGTGNPVCRYDENEVGDQDGIVKNPSTGKWYVANPEDIK